MSSAERDERRRGVRNRRLRRVARWTLTAPFKVLWWTARKAFGAGWSLGRWAIRRRRDRQEALPEAPER